MKKVLVLLVTVATLGLMSCEEEPPCECQEQTYNYRYDIPSGNKAMINVEFENVGCTDELEETEIPNTSDGVELVKYRKIVCL